MTAELDKSSEFLFYKSDDGSIKVGVILGEETVWASQGSMADIFNTTKQNISYHIINILKENELEENSTVKEILTVQKEGERDVSRKVTVYNLDMIIAVGYRVNSYQATQFRIWATKILKEYLIKGFTLDDERLKQGNQLFGKDYFSELERIREIRASERLFYKKITDLYQQCSIDYDKNSPITQRFFATVQNKLEFAITNHTAAELIAGRASAKKPNMGLSTWAHVKDGGKILKADVKVAKNYLTEKELSELNLIVTMYLDYAELSAKRQQRMTMIDWVERLDAFLKFNQYDILTNAGSISAEVAKRLAEKEYEKYRPIQDKAYRSDFDKFAKGLTDKKKTIEIQEVKEPPKEDLSTFNRNLKKALNYKPKDK